MFTYRIIFKFWSRTNTTMSIATETSFSHRAALYGELKLSFSSTVVVRRSQFLPKQASAAKYKRENKTGLKLFWKFVFDGNYVNRYFHLEPYMREMMLKSPVDNLAFYRSQFLISVPFLSRICLVKAMTFLKAGSFYLLYLCVQIGMTLAMNCFHIWVKLIFLYRQKWHCIDISVCKHHEN